MSGYYAWRKRPQSKREKENRRLVVEIKAIHQESKQTYGSPRIFKSLQNQGYALGKNRVARIMKLHGIEAKQKKRFQVTTDSNHNRAVAENILDRHFMPKAPNQAWASDITYVWTGKGWLYLAVVMDLFSRRVIGWSMQKTMHRCLVMDALRMALAKRTPSEGLIHHSDRGSQYASSEYQEILQRAGITCSMSRRGNCWDNAPVESFFATLKRELIYRKRYRSRTEARADIFAYLEVWYNRKRIHSTLSYLSPVKYEAQYYNQQRSIAA